MSKPVVVDWYAILGCSLESSKEQIAKAARKQALRYHPDRNADPKAKDMFLKIQNAKDFLLDETKRKEYDDSIMATRKRKEFEETKTKNMDVKRKKMKSEFESRLNGLKGQVDTSSNDMAYMDQIKKKKLQKMEDLRKEEEEMEVREAKAKAYRNFLSSLSKGRDEESVRVKWSTKDVSHSEESLYQLLKVYGGIEEVKLIEGKGNQAIVTFSTSAEAAAAVDAYATSEVMRVTGMGEAYKKKAAIFTHMYNDSDPTRNNLSGAASSLHGVYSDLEKEMRRAVERESLLRSMQGGASDHDVSYGSGTSAATLFGGNVATATPVAAPVDLKSRENDILARMKAAALKKNAAIV